MQCSIPGGTGTRSNDELGNMDDGIGCDDSWSDLKRGSFKEEFELLAESFTS